jgi:ATP-dependent helicase HrpB
LAISEAPLAATDLTAVREVLYPQIIARWDSLQPQRQPEVANWLARVEFLRRNFPDDGWPELTDAALQRWAWDVCYGCQNWEEVQQAPWLAHLPSLLPGDLMGRLEVLAPSDWKAPSGNRVSITYEPGAPPKLSVRLQELFGLAETPRIAQGRVPLLLELLGPNYRPQQLTSDLPSFWANTYPQIRKELARRYPKHHWPEDPRQAPATRTGLKRDVPS